MAEVKVIVKTVDQGSKNMKAFGENVKKNTDGLKKFAVGVVAVGVAVKKAFDFGQAGANIKQLEQSFEGMNERVFQTPDLLDKMREATRGTIKDTELMSGLLTLTAGATDTLAQAMAGAAPKLLEIAKASNKLNPTLGDTSFLYQSLAKGIKRSSPLILDNLGIIVKIEAANKKYADSVGKTVSALSAEEKQMALLNAVLESGDRLIDQAGGSADSAADAYGRLSVATSDLKDELFLLINEGLNPSADALAGGVTAATANAKAQRAVRDAIREGFFTTERYNKQRRELVESGLSMVEANVKIAETLNVLGDNWANAASSAADADRKFRTSAEALALVAQYAGDADRKFKEVEYDLEQLIKASEGSTTALEGQARTNVQAARVMAATEKAAKDLADRQKFLEETTGEATKAIEEEAAALRQLKLDAFTSALEDTGEPLKFFNETLDELGPQMVLFGGRTADQNRILGEARDKYKDLDRAIVDLSIGLDGLGLSEEERSEKLGELIEQQQQLLPLIGDLESVQGAANMVVQEATLNEEALNRELYNQVAALSDDAEQLALTAGALGLYNEEQLRAALQAAALEEATALAAKAIAQEGVDANLAFEALLDFAQGNADSFEAALTHRQELENLNAQLDEIPGTYEAEIRAETAQAEAALERVRRAAIEASKDRTATITIRTINLTEHRESVRGSIPGMQHGGPVLAGNPYIVGERGPELFVPTQSGQIIPNNQLDIGGMTVNVNVSSGNPAVIGREVAGTVANELGNMMRG